MLLVSGLLAAGAAHAQLTLITGGVYDENLNQPNFVDSSVTAYTVAQFTADVATAHAAGFGGVIAFDEFLNNTQISGNSIQAPFDSGSKTLNITVPGNAGWITNGLGSANPISRGISTGAFGTDNDDSGVADFDFQFGSITGPNALSGERVDSLGFTYIGRSNGGSLNNASQTTITVTYSDLSTEVYTIAANNAAGERFLGFQAPTGEGITRLQITGIADRRTFIDDLGFTTIPEPSTYAALAGALALGLVAWRRRR